METNLIFKRIGNYSMGISDPLKHHCKECGNARDGSIIVQTLNEELMKEDNWICGDCLLHHYDSTKGLHVTDRIEDLLQIICDPENQPHQFVGDKELLFSKFFWVL